MATRKSAAAKSKKSASKKSASKKSAPSRTALRPGAIPPYGVAIRDAIARGDAQEMKRLAASARKYVNDIQTALAKLDKSLGK